MYPLMVSGLRITAIPMVNTSTAVATKVKNLRMMGITYFLYMIQFIVLIPGQKI